MQNATLEASMAQNWPVCFLDADLSLYIAVHSVFSIQLQEGSDARACADLAGWGRGMSSCQWACAVCRPAGRSSVSSTRVCSRTPEHAGC